MRPLWALTVLVATMGGACGGDNGMMMPADQSLLVVQVDFTDPFDIRQFNLHLHAATVPAGVPHDQDLFFPTTPSSSPLPSGSTMGVLLPIAVTDMLDLTVFGKDANQLLVAMGSKQAMIKMGAQSNVTIDLAPPPPPP